MAGNTKGTYRSRSAGGRGVPEPPVIDFAWLKQWWPECSRREPANKKPKKRKWVVRVPPSGNAEMHNEVLINAETKLDARIIVARLMKLTKVPNKRAVSRIA